MLYFETKSFADMTPEEEARCHTLTLPGDSSMRILLDTGKKWRGKQKHLVAVLGRIGPDIVAWSALERVAKAVYISLFVDPEYRRRKIGSALLAHSLQQAGEIWPRLKPTVWPHDDVSDAFFQKMHGVYVVPREVPLTQEEFTWIAEGEQKSPSSA